MSEQIRESISALMDGEANELEIERLLNQTQDPELRRTWQRFQWVSQSMSQTRGAYDFDVSSKVMEAIEAEDQAENIQPVARAHQFKVRDLLKPLASFAVAASMFASVLVGGQLYGLVGSDLEGEPQAQLANRVSPVGMVNTVGGTSVNANYGAPTIKSNPQGKRAEYNRLARRQLQRYLLPHTDEATLNTPQGMLPYARLASLRVEE